MHEWLSKDHLGKPRNWTIEEKAVMFDQILESLHEFSPSAPYELRQQAIKRRVDYEYGGSTYPWWLVYPEGHHAAFVFRVLRILGHPGWEVEGQELPE